MITFNFDKEAAGWCYKLNGNAELWALREDGRFVYVGAYVDTYDANTVSYVTLTGRYAIGKDGNAMYETTEGDWICMADGWQKYELAYKVTQEVAQSLVNRIIAADRKIIANNILCARFADKLLPEQRTQLYNLQLRLQNRQSALENDGLCKDIKKGYPEGYSELESYLSSFMASGGVGVAIWAIVVVAAVVIASLSTAAYFAYKAYAAEAEQDVKYSTELTKALTSKLTEEEYNQLLNETKGIVTKAKIRQSLSNYSRLIGIGLAIAGGLFIASKFKNNETK